MDSVIVTGATSMLGLALINECIARGTEVIAIIRGDSLRRNRIPETKTISVIECDLAYFSALDYRDSKGFDAFYHFAWEGTDKEGRYVAELQCKNIEHTLNAVNLAHRLGCKKFIGAGSQAEYGRVSGTISPDMRVSPDSAYGIAKYAAGRLSSILCAQLEMEFVWTRIFSTYGINDMPSTMIMYCIDCLLKGEKPILTKCEQIWDYLNCEDAARAFYLIGEMGKDQTVYHIGSGQASPLLEYVTIIRDAIDPSLPLGIGEKNYAPKQVMHLCPDISSLQKDTGFKPSISFEQGILKIIKSISELRIITI